MRLFATRLDRSHQDMSQLAPGRGPQRLSTRLSRGRVELRSVQAQAYDSQSRSESGSHTSLSLDGPHGKPGDQPV